MICSAARASAKRLSIATRIDPAVVRWLEVAFGFGSPELPQRIAVGRFADRGASITCKSEMCESNARANAMACGKTHSANAERSRGTRIELNILFSHAQRAQR